MAVKIKFKNQDLNYFGPTPLVSVSSGTGENNSVVNTITLEGKIFLPRVGQNDTNIGISILIPLENQLRTLFQPNTSGQLIIECDNSNLNFLNCDPGKPIICSVKNYSANKTSDNWTFSIDYTIELEYIDNYADRSNPCPEVPIRSFTDSWDIVPEQDESWYNLDINPQNNGDQIITAGGANGGGIKNSVLRYSVTHRVSAVGYNAATGVKPIDVNAAETRKDYAGWMNAKSFVHCYLNKGSLNASFPFANTNTNNMMMLATNTAGVALNFYNHVRSFNIDKNNNSYEITDTWVALTKDVAYLEDYTVEYTADSQFDSELTSPPCSVTINGSIQGLSIATTGSLESNPFGGNFPPSGNSSSYNNIEYRKIGGTVIDPNPGLLPNKIIAITKAESALHAWYNYVEPALHTRAVSLASVLRAENLRQSGGVTSAGVATIRNASRLPNTATQAGLNPMNPSGVYLNKNPVSKTFGYNPKTGQITYSYRFVSQPTNFMKKITRFSINEDISSSIVNEVFILGRKRGPLLQDTGASTIKSRTLSIEIQANIPRKVDELSPLFTTCPANTGHEDYKTLLDYVDMMRPIMPANWTPKLINDAIEEVRRNGGTPITVPRSQVNGELYIVSESDSWDPLTGRLGKTITWKWD